MSRQAVRRTVRTLCTCLLLVAAVAPVVRAQEAVEGPKVILSSVPFSLTVHGGAEISSLVEVRAAGGMLLASGTVGAGEERELRDLSVDSRDALPLQVRIGETVHEVSAPYAPAWFSILPPLIAIALALIFKEVITALLAGIWLGALAVAGYNPLQAT